MADFRKLFLALALVALLAGSAVTANAQFKCTATAGVPPLLRSDGITELVGDVVLTCDGTVPSVGITANIRIFLNANVTSRLVGTGNEALLLIDEPAAAQQVYCPAGSTCLAPLANVFQGLQTDPNTVDWLGVPIVAPGSSGNNRVYRITNVRANANQLGTSSSLIPTQVSMFISISGTTSALVERPQQTVGFIVKGLNFSTGSDVPDPDIPAVRGFRQCEDPEDTGPLALNFNEGFGSAFKVRGYPTSGFPLQNVPGQIYDTETGFTPTTSPPAGIGTADTGTRLMARFIGNPDGLELKVPILVGSTVVGGQDIQLVSGADSNGEGGSLATPNADNEATISVSSGTATLVYEVVGTTTQVNVSRAALDKYLVLVTVALTSSPPGLTSSPATVNGSFAPLSIITEADDSDSPIPRFADNSETKDAFGLNACRTLLLFPYLTNAVGFDSGVAISNTSADPFDTDPQSGACTLNYYGNIPSTGAPAPAPVTTPSVDGGEQLAFVMSTGGGVVGTTKTCTGCATPGFNGYMIAICNFQYAHGFAFVSDLGAARVSEAYLALIIPDKTDLRSADSFSLGAGSNDGEQLVH